LPNDHFISIPNITLPTIFTVKIWFKLKIDNSLMDNFLLKISESVRIGLTKTRCTLDLLYYEIITNEDHNSADIIKENTLDLSIGSSIVKKTIFKNEFIFQNLKNDFNDSFEFDHSKELKDNKWHSFLLVFNYKQGENYLVLRFDNDDKLHIKINLKPNILFDFVFNKNSYLYLGKNIGLIKNFNF
jgi:hypothetical protein